MLREAVHQLLRFHFVLLLHYLVVVPREDALHHFLESRECVLVMLNIMRPQFSVRDSLSEALGVAAAAHTALLRLDCLGSGQRRGRLLEFGLLLELPLFLVGVVLLRLLQHFDLAVLLSSDYGGVHVYTYIDCQQRHVFRCVGVLLYRFHVLVY